MPRLVKFRQWMARRLSPELAADQDRLSRLLSSLENDSRWLAPEFPEIRVFACRALFSVGSRPGFQEAQYPLYGTDWSWDIRAFRDQMREKYRRIATVKEGK